MGARVTVPEHDGGSLGGPPRVTYLIGACNSVGVIEDTLESIAKRLADVPAEIIVIENGSTDGTPERLAALRSDWPKDAPALVTISTPKGLGNAMRAGIAASTGTLVVITADDLPFGFDDLDGAEKYDIRAKRLLIGSKGHPQSEIERSFVRSVLTWGYRTLRWMILGIRAADTQGTLLMDGVWVRALEPTLQETGFLVTTEIAYAAELSGYRAVEMPVRLRKAGHPTRVRLSDISDMGTGLLRLRKRRRALREAATAHGLTAAEA